MESPLSNSFIPQDATSTQASRTRRGGGMQDLFTLLSIVLFIASVALAVAVFLYAQYLNAQSNLKAGEIQQAQQSFNSSLIDQIERLSDRIKSSEAILSQHLAPTAFFEALNQSTLQTISFQTLDLDATDPSNINIKMTGVAQSMNSIAYQADLFSQNGVITDPIFSGIDREADGVHFDLMATIDPSAINYGQLLQAAQSGQTPSGVNQLPQTSASSSATTQQTVAPTQSTSNPSPSPSSSATAPSSPTQP